jgi:hypothetical protein
VSDRNDAVELFNAIKIIVDNYVNNRQMAAMVVGKYNGSVIIAEDLQLPMSIVFGNMKSQLVSGDNVILLRNDGGDEYYILEISGKPYQITTGG